MSAFIHAQNDYLLNVIIADKKTRDEAIQKLREYNSRLSSFVSVPPSSRIFSKWDVLCERFLRQKADCESTRSAAFQKSFRAHAIPALVLPHCLSSRVHILIIVERAPRGASFLCKTAGARAAGLESRSPVNGLELDGRRRRAPGEGTAASSLSTKVSRVLLANRTLPCRTFFEA